MLEEREKSILETEEKFQNQEHQLIEQNMKIEELQKALKVNTDIDYIGWHVCRYSAAKYNDPQMIHLYG